MTPNSDGREAERAMPQQTTTPPSTAGIMSKQSETLSSGTLALSGPKQGLPPVFGRYRVQGLLGGGGMGAVYLVVNTELEREEALKVPHFNAADDPQVRERFLREAKAAAGLDHPNLCPVYDVGVRDGVYYLTMRYLRGKLLSEYGNAAQPPAEAVDIVVKLAQALATAHAKGVIHRDLKPNNIMMCAGVGPVVMDFGLAKQTDRHDKALTQMGTTLGTPAYMPPEQVTGELDRMGPASDVYSLGVILFQLLTGRLPFEGRTTAEVFGKILHVAAPAPSSLRPGLPPALDAICAKALAKTPEGRYASMKEFADALTDYSKAKAAVGKSERGRARRLTPAAALILLMLGGLGVAGVYLWMKSINAPAPNTALVQAQPAPALEPKPASGAVPAESPVKKTPASEPTSVEPPVKPGPIPPEGVPAEIIVKPPMRTFRPQPGPNLGPPANQMTAEEAEHLKALVAANPDHKVAIEEFYKSASHAERKSFWDGNKPADEQSVQLTAEEAEHLKVLLAARPHTRDVIEKYYTAASHANRKAFWDENKPADDKKSPDQVITNSIGMKLKLIRAGKFMMGEKGRPRIVEITDPYYLGLYPVTKAQFAAFVNSAHTPYKTEAEHVAGRISWRNPGFTQTDDDPVVCVSWNDATRFCAWLSLKEMKTYELPSEAEWEYACRAGTTTAYSFGDDSKKLDEYAWYRDNSDHRTHPVGGKKPNPWGLYDMHGNVLQWCADFYDEKKLSITGVARGGSWSADGDGCRAAARLGRVQNTWSNFLGMRVCLRPD